MLVWLAPAASIAEPLFTYGYSGCPQQLALLGLGLSIASVADPSPSVYLWLVWLPPTTGTA